MDRIIELLIAGTPLDILGFSGLCGISFLGSFIAASLGLGGGLLVLATMTLFLPPAVLVPLHGIVQVGSNGFRIWLMRGDALYTVAPAFIVGTLLGAWIGGKTVFALETWVLQMILGLFVLYATWAPSFTSRKPGPVKFLSVGIAGGFATMFVGGTGPLARWLAGFPPPFSSSWRLKTTAATTAPEEIWSSPTPAVGGTTARLSLSHAHTASLARTHARTNGTNRIRFPGWTHPPNLRS